MSKTATSGTAGEDERLHRRCEGRLEASLLVEGRRWRCWIRDISLGGAGLEPEIPAALGKAVVLSSPSLAFRHELPGRVVNVAGRRTCLAFDLDPETRDELRAFLAAATPTA